MAHVNRLRACIARDDPALRDAEEKVADCRNRLGERPALDRVQAVFGLTAFERDVLVLCAGVHLDSSFAEACASATPRGTPTFGLALAAFPQAHWSALIPRAPLRAWNLVTLESGAGVAIGALTIDEWVLHVLAGVPYLDERLAPYIETLEDAESPFPSHAAIGDALARRWTSGAKPEVSELSGAERSLTRAIVSTAAATAAIDAFVMAVADIPAGAVERFALARAWERTCALFPSVLLLEAEDDVTAAAQSFLRALHAPIVVGARVPTAFGAQCVARFAVGTPTASERVSALRDALAGDGASLNGAVERVSAHFHFDSDQIATIAADLGSREPAERNGAALWEASRTAARPALEDLGTRIVSSVGWEDIVLAPLQRTILSEIVTQTRERETVYDRWGFGRKSARGLGISALFAGASGTGKTLAAEVIANELKIDLYRIDLSATISKYIGETEKNLRRIFDAAERSGAVLLFDEADALFGKRTEIKDSHDRYANVEVSYLLQRMEAYSGLAILTTNLKSALDSAFLRRLRFVVHFGFPDSNEREELWRRVFPPELPAEQLDYGQLARLNVTGGTIRNIALGAAFAAAESGGPLRMGHIARAVRSEFIKLEKSFSETEIAKWQ